jgi:hypothetical protein
MSAETNEHRRKNLIKQLSEYVIMPEELREVIRFNKTGFGTFKPIKLIRSVKYKKGYTVKEWEKVWKFYTTPGI